MTDQAWGEMAKKIVQAADWDMFAQQINEAVARKLGYTSVSYYHNNELTGIPPGLGPAPDDGQSNFKVLPDYCHSIEAAWEIVAALQHNCDFKLTTISGWTATFMDYIKETKSTASADTAPMAICEAFLKLP